MPDWNWRREGPIAITDRGGGNATGLAGLHLSAKANLTTERPQWPGIGVRFEALLPVGREAGSGLGGFASILATRSFGRNRLHLNAGTNLGRPDTADGVEPLPRWRVGLAVDHTLLQTSTLLVIEFVLERGRNVGDASLSPGVGFRRRLTPTLVLDAGVSLERSSFTLGLSHAFGIAGLMPGVRL